MHIVDYHIIQVIYFEDTVGTPNAFDCANVWSELSAMGNHRVSAGFWSKMSPSTTKKNRRYTLGDQGLFSTLLVQDDGPIQGIATSERKDAARNIMDCDFSMSVFGASRCKLGPTPPYFMLVISNHWILEAGIETVLRIMRHNFTTFSTHAPFYGFIDIVRPEETLSGYVYTSTRHANLPVHRWVEQELWARLMNHCSDKARGVYWGNYFGPHILERLGGRNNFINRFSEYATLNDRRPSALSWDFENGVFVSLSLDPGDCSPGKSLGLGVIFNLERLLADLADHKAIVGTE